MIDKAKLLDALDTGLRRALPVVRAAEVEIAAGTSWVTVDGVSPFVDERSVQARLTGEAAGVKVLSARVRWRTHLERALGREEIEALVQKERAAQRAVREQASAYVQSIRRRVLARANDAAREPAVGWAASAHQAMTSINVAVGRRLPTLRN